MNSAVSLEFLAWMIATTGLYWLAPPFLRRFFLMLSTTVVLVAVDLSSLIALASMTAVVYAVTRVRGYREPAVLLIGCAAIIFALLVFKYLDANSAATSIMDWVVPLGLSFYSLRCAHLLMDRYLERISRPTGREIVEYLFFPATIIAGPINRFPEFIAQESPDFRVSRFSEGLERILYGYVKIVVLSNYLFSTKFMPWAMSLVEPGSGQYQYLDALDYGMTLYLQFSGYSDIAIGFALLLGHKVIENFSWPFLRSNLSEFWRSWNISLTTLSREYVFASVYASTRRAWVAVLATMLAISLWHGLTANYFAWGLYHSMGLLIHRSWSGSSAAALMRARLPTALNYFLGWLITFQFVILGFIFTKETDLGAAVDAWGIFIRGIFGNV